MGRRRAARPDRLVGHPRRAGPRHHAHPARHPGQLGDVPAPRARSRSSVAQVDQMSGGRVELGLGTGWFEDEHRAFGLPFPPVGNGSTGSRSSCRSCRGCGPATAPFDFDGEHYQLSGNPALTPSRCSPRCRSSSAGAAPSARRGSRPPTRTSSTGASPRSQDTADAFDRVRAACAETGRELVLSVAHAALRRAGTTPSWPGGRPAIGRDLDELRANALAGTPAEVVDRIGRLRRGRRDAVLPAGAGPVRPGPPRPGRRAGRAAARDAAARRPDPGCDASHVVLGSA